MIVQSMRESIKHIHIYIYIYIKKKMLLILTCSQMFYLFFWVVCILLNQIPAPQMMNPDDFLQTVFLRALYQHQMFNYTDIIW